MDKGFHVGGFWYLIVFLIAAAVTAAVAPLNIKLAKHFNLIDYPDGRRVNERPVPRPGGIALFLGILVPLSALLLFKGTDSTDEVMGSLSTDVNYFGVALSAAVVFVVGLIDDIRAIRVRYKFLGQIIAACIACYSGVLFSHIANPLGDTLLSLGYFAYPVTIFYLVAFANIINLLDGVDGLAAGVVAISSVTLFIVAVGKGGVDAGLLAMVLAGSCLAFLLFNSYPARLFMGDSGALLLGYLLGLVSLFGTVRTPALITLAVPVVVAGIPVVDTFSAIVRRLRAKRSIVDADTEHIHHRLLDIGFDQKTTVYILYVLSGLLSVCALLLTQYSGWIRWAILVVLLVMVSLLVTRLKLTEPVLKHHYNKRVVRKSGASKRSRVDDQVDTEGQLGMEDQILAESQVYTDTQIVESHQGDIRGPEMLIADNKRDI